MGRWRRYAGAASGAVLGAIAGNLPGAFIGGNLGYKYGKASESSYPNNSKMPRTYPTPSTGSRGSRKRKLSSRAGTAGAKRVKKTLFVGQSERSAFLKAVGRSRNPRRNRKRVGGKAKLGKFKRMKKNKNTIESRCLSQGYHKTIEQYGGINDPDCCHIVHSTAHVNEMCYTIASAATRKLLTKAGLKITNLHNTMDISDPIAGANPVPNSVGLKFVLTSRSPTGVPANIEYVSVASQSFSGLMNSWGTLFGNKLIDYIRKTTQDIPYRIAVYTLDVGAVSSFYRLGAEMFLEDTTIELYMHSSLTVQNRTKAALDSEGVIELLNIDRIDAQPLKGFIYEFNHADPRVRHGGAAIGSTAEPFTNQFFNLIASGGINLIRGASFEPAQEPLSPKYFANCTKSTNCSLQPGELKKLAFKFDIKMTFVNLMKRLTSATWFTIGTQTFYSGLFGKSQMISLEELLRTPTTNKITLAYERELKIGSVVTEKRKQPVMESKLVTEPYNNVI